MSPLASPWGSLRGIVFDFDGVVIESVDIKTQAFLELFSDRQEHLPAIRQHHLENVGHSRYRKFAWIYRELFDEPLTDALSKELGRRYSEVVFDQVLGCPFVAGAPELLEALRGRCPAFVASGTPEEELLEVVARRGLEPYFREVRGAPTLKPEILEQYRDQLGCPAEQLLMIGDGLTDLRAAKAVGTRFVGRVFLDRPSPFDGHEVPVVANLAELARKLGL